MTSPRNGRNHATSPSKREFGHGWNGYDRNEVRSYLASLETEMQRLIADRDSALAQSNALAQQLEEARAENNKLAERVEELKEPPKNLEDLDDRMQRVGHLAYLRAEEITARAQTATEEDWKATAKASIALRERYRTLLKELDTHAEALHAEHRAALEETRNEVQQLMVDAVQRRDALDAEAEQKRRAIEQEFDTNMASQRSDLDKFVADQRTASKQQAERRISDATTEAHRIVSEATSESNRLKEEADAMVDKLLAISNDAHRRLVAADEALVRSQKAIEPTDDEQLPVPRAEEADQQDDARQPADAGAATE